MDKSPPDLPGVRRLPKEAAEYYARRLQIEDVCVALVGEIYTDVPVMTIKGDRRVKVGTGAVVRPP
eukprot:3491438-Pyramimonas_sp.AAC.1